MIQVNNGLEFFLWLKLLKLNEQGKTTIPPCEMKMQICINLYEFIENWREEETTFHEAKEAVKEILEKMQKAFDCPLGWQITAQRDVYHQLCLEAKSFTSREFCYSPANNQTEIDLSFVNGWLFEEVKVEDIDFSDLYLDDKDREEIARIQNN